VSDVPHLAWPFRFEAASQALQTVEQDALEDVQQSVYAYLACPKGARPLNPDWGVEDPTFASYIDGAALAAEIEASEENRALVNINVFGPDGSGAATLDVYVDLPD
jgi:phage baseplate assembly protein W